jgi:hypothetical protein
VTGARARGRACAASGCRPRGRRRSHRISGRGGAGRRQASSRLELPRRSLLRARQNAAHRTSAAAPHPSRAQLRHPRCPSCSQPRCMLTLRSLQPDSSALADYSQVLRQALVRARAGPGTRRRQGHGRGRSGAPLSAASSPRHRGSRRETKWLEAGQGRDELAQEARGAQRLVLAGAASCGSVRRALFVLRLVLEREGRQQGDCPADKAGVCRCSRAQMRRAGADLWMRGDAEEAWAQRCRVVEASEERMKGARGEMTGSGAGRGGEADAGCDLWRGGLVVVVGCVTEDERVGLEG